MWCLALISLESDRAVELRLGGIGGAPVVWCSSALLLVGGTRLTWWLGVVSLGVFSSAGLPVPLGVVLRVGGPVLWSHVVEGVGWGGVDEPLLVCWFGPGRRVPAC